VAANLTGTTAKVGVSPALHEEGPAVNGADRDRDIVIVG
jgi:hypothetical protein